MLRNCTRLGREETKTLKKGVSFRRNGSLFYRKNSQIILRNGGVSLLRIIQIKGLKLF